MRRVILESPYAGNVRINVAYARACIRDCLLRGEAPIASHLLYPQEGILNDTIPEERELGIAAGIEWGAFAEATVVYIDFGISRGMQYGIKRAEAERRPIEYRRIPSLIKLTEGACEERRKKELLHLAYSGGCNMEFWPHLIACADCKSVMHRLSEDGSKAFGQETVFRLESLES